VGLEDKLSAWFYWLREKDLMGYEPKKTIAYLQWFWMLASGVKR